MGKGDARNLQWRHSRERWIPACAGTTVSKGRHPERHQRNHGPPVWRFAAGRRDATVCGPTKDMRLPVLIHLLNDIYQNVFDGKGNVLLEAALRGHSYFGPL